MSIVSLSRFAGPPHGRAVDVDPVLGRGQRRGALGLQVGAAQVRQHDRQLVVGDGDLAARLAVHDRDRRSPSSAAGTAASRAAGSSPHRRRVPRASSRSMIVAIAGGLVGQAVQVDPS